MTRRHPSRFSALALLGLLMPGVAQAQWLTQTNLLKPGWNAVYLHVEVPHKTVERLVVDDPDNPVQEIWKWSPTPNAAQYLSNPQSPPRPADWTVWTRSAPSRTTLEHLTGNAAYLVHNSASTNYPWRITGNPLAPGYHWTSSGLNFIGFPTPPSPDSPTFAEFLQPAPDLHDAEIAQYAGGSMETSLTSVLDRTVTRVVRGQAFWMKTTQFNSYFGPFDVVGPGASGLRFGDSIGQIAIRLRNQSPSVVQVSLASIPSEGAPANQPAIRAPVPILIRGQRNPITLTYSNTVLGRTPVVWSLQPKGQVGSEVEIVFGVDRSQFAEAPGTRYASILRFTDDSGLTQIDVPVSAQVGSIAGLWVGNATVTHVNHSLRRYATAKTPDQLASVLARLGLGEGIDGYHYQRVPDSGYIQVFGGPEGKPAKQGEYLPDGADRSDSGAVARPFHLRLIVHHDGTAARLLQKVYLGMGIASNVVVATAEEALAASSLSTARRISCAHLPTSRDNDPWLLDGHLAPGGTAVAAVTTQYSDHSSNPFLHTFHPDHDNLSANFKESVNLGVESYEIQRRIQLRVTRPVSDDFDTLTQATTTLEGDYGDDIKLVVSRNQGSDRGKEFHATGFFLFKRVSDIPTLTIATP